MLYLHWLAEAQSALALAASGLCLRCPALWRPCQQTLLHSPAEYITGALPAVSQIDL